MGLKPEEGKKGWEGVGKVQWIKGFSVGQSLRKLQ